ncbi:unnamed protein product [Echinostoma caproni]|uniref:Neuroendocrine protein 7B2 n=1 Tax=Echinostoma caproni TaxID=27848 RepID=A0A3P8GWP2_9TREM|nr:unnamed protein product [Echinostoma caproni]
MLSSVFYNQCGAHNYDNYFAQLAAESQSVHDQFLRENPRASYILERLNSNDYLNGHPILHESPGFREGIDDYYWQTFMKDLNNARRLAAQRDDDTEEFESAFPQDVFYSERQSASDLDKVANLKGPEISSRRIEVAEQNPLWGEHKVSGGSSETGQWLDYALLGAERQESDADDSANTLTDYTDAEAIAQINHGRPFKNDTLPAYCDPPNPCPIGYDPESLPTPCDPNYSKYTMELNRDLILSKMVSGECICDTEHMNSCSYEASRPLAYSPLMDWPQSSIEANPYMHGQLRKRLVAKKSFSPKSLRRNEYLKGQILKAVVKKTGPYTANE